MDDTDDRVFVITLGATALYEPTTRLRWSKDGQLQQAWQNIHGPDVEWRDVPTEGAEDL